MLYVQVCVCVCVCACARTCACMHVCWTFSGFIFRGGHLPFHGNCLLPLDCQGHALLKVGIDKYLKSKTT